MSGKISQAEAEVRRQAYRDTHPVDLTPLANYRTGERKICTTMVGLELHHIAGGRLVDEYEVPANYIMQCGFPRGRCHHGYSHAGDLDISPGEDKARVMLFAVKYLIKEARFDEIEYLMRGRTWWYPGMDKDAKLKDVIKEKAKLLDAGWSKKKYISIVKSYKRVLQSAVGRGKGKRGTRGV